jgi:hypothetical protein
MVVTERHANHFQVISGDHPASADDGAEVIAQLATVEQVTYVAGFCTELSRRFGDIHEIGHRLTSVYGRQRDGLNTEKHLGGFGKV